MKLKILKAIIALSGITFIVGGMFLNSTYVVNKEEVAYAEIKVKYGVAPVTEVEEIVEEQPVKTEQEQVQPEEITPVPDNRTTEEIIWDFLIGSGYSKIQTAAVIGNLYQESGLNSSRIEMKTKEGIGIAQWSFGRKQQLKDYCAGKGVEWTDLNSQLEFLVKEMNSNQFHKKHKVTFDNPYSVDDAVEAFCLGFERPKKSKANLPNRQKQAWAAYNRNVDR